MQHAGQEAERPQQRMGPLQVAAVAVTTAGSSGRQPAVRYESAGTLLWLRRSIKSCISEEMDFST